MTELIIQIEDTSILPSLKRVMKSIRGVKGIGMRTANPAISPTAQRLLKDLDTFITYPKGWDGDSAEPLSPVVIKNFRNLLKKSNEEDLQDWNIFPEKNGTLILENSQRQAQINIADKEYSYFLMDGTNLKGEDHLKLTANHLLQTIKAINHG